MEPGPAQSDPRRSGAVPLVVLLAALVVVSAACSPTNPEEPSASVGPSLNVSPTPSAVSSPASTPAATAAALDQPLAGSGSIAIARQDGSLWLMDVDGVSTSLADAQDGTFGFPTWSPDGSQIAAVRSTGTEAAIVIFDVERAMSGLPFDPAVIFESSSIGPFYLSWTPDGREVSFLANESDDLSLRIVPVDGTAPIDGSGLGAVIRTGSPLYYDWIGPDLLIAHIGTGPEAFLGEIGRNDAKVAAAIATPGAFRSVDVSGDGQYVAFVRAGKDGKDEVVVAARDGSVEQTMPVFGMAAVDFGPNDGTLASIGRVEASETPLDLPVGPLRLLDPRSGVFRTLLDDPVVSFAWSPDGTTIAAIRLVDVADGSNVSSASPTTSPAPTGRIEIRLTFVDVATGEIRSQPVVAPGPTYVNALMTYFDQYALSHRLWAPDSSSILLPQLDPDGTTHVDVFFPDGDPPVSLEGEIGFWSP